MSIVRVFVFFFFQAEDGIRDGHVTGVQTCALPISEVLRDTNSISLSKPHCFITPTDIRSLVGMELIYDGKLGDYQYKDIPDEVKQVEQREPLPKPSFFLLITKRVKQFVIR